MSEKTMLQVVVDGVTREVTTTLNRNLETLIAAYLRENKTDVLRIELVQEVEHKDGGLKVTAWIQKKRGRPKKRKVS